VPLRRSKVDIVARFELRAPRGSGLKTRASLAHDNDVDSALA
jgi:hypothetical protein